MRPGRGSCEDHSRRGIEKLMAVMFPDAKNIQAHLISEGDRFEQLAEMACRIDGPTSRVNDCRYKTVYADLHWLVILVQAVTRCWKRPANAERTLRNAMNHSTVTIRAKGR